MASDLFGPERPKPEGPDLGEEISEESLKRWLSLPSDEPISISMKKSDWDEFFFTLMRIPRMAVQSSAIAMLLHLGRIDEAQSMIREQKDLSSQAFAAIRKCFDSAMRSSEAGK